MMANRLPAGLMQPKGQLPETKEWRGKGNTITVHLTNFFQYFAGFRSG